MYRETPYTVPIKSWRDENETLRTFFFELPLAAMPGQFIMMNLHGVGEKPFSILTDGPNGFAATIKRLGPFTQELFNKKPGDLVSIRGPFGRGFEPRGDRILLVGGGYANPPLHFFAESLQHVGLELLVSVNGARAEDDLLYVEEFENLCDRSLLATDDGSIGMQGTAVDLMREVLAEDNFDMVYVSGPERMSAAAVKELKKRDLPYQVCLERYMKCGVGVCGSCVMDPTGLVLCMEGPVVDDRDLEAITDFGNFHRGKTGQVLPI